MVRPDGWSDAELFALLQQLRASMTDYIYSTDEAFAQTIQLTFRGKTLRHVMEMVRDLMNSLSFAMKSRKFTNEDIIVDGGCVYPCEFLYETMVVQPENRRGGVWDPDELRKCLRKMETYRHLFDKNPEMFFARAQIWSKNVPDVRTKFYLWRDIYLEEKKNESVVWRSDAEIKRVRWLARVFEDVPPAPSPLPPTPSPVAAARTYSTSPTKTPTQSRTSHRRQKKGPPMWTAEDLETFVALLVRITLEIQEHGVSALVKELGPKLNRTLPSIIRKLQDIRNRFVKQGAYPRASQIPSVIFDKSSVAHKIFTADWTNRNDPYTLGIGAIRDLNNRSVAILKSKGRRLPPPRLQMEMRPRTPLPHSEETPPESTTTPKTASSAPQKKPQIHPIAKIATCGKAKAKPNSSANLLTATRQEPTCSEFVRDCAAMIKCEEPYAQKLCNAMRSALPVYTAGTLDAFFNDVAAEMGVEPRAICLRSHRILGLCEQRYGSTDCFAAAIEGSEVDTHTVVQSTSLSTMPPTLSPFSDSGPEAAPITPAKDTEMDDTTSPSRSPVRPAGEETKTATAVPTNAPNDTTEASKQFSKSCKTADQILRQQGEASRDSTIAHEFTESSPSVYHRSLDHFEFEYDGGDNDTVHEEPDCERRGDVGEDDDDDDDETQSLASSGAVSADEGSSDYGDNDCAVAHPRRHHQQYQRHDHRSASSKLHVSSKKTVVVKRLPQSCRCTDCERRRRAGGRSCGGTTVTSVHRKRSRSELYARNGHWVEDHRAVHEVAHKHLQYRPREEADDSEEDMTEREAAELDSMWSTLMAPIESGIAELEAKRREQKERDVDRERQAKEKHWKKQLRQQVRDEWAATTKTADGERLGR